MGNLVKNYFTKRQSIIERNAHRIFKSSYGKARTRKSDIRFMSPFLPSRMGSFATCFGHSMPRCHVSVHRRLQEGRRTDSAFDLRTNDHARRVTSLSAQRKRDPLLRSTGGVFSAFISVHRRLK
ncbi:MAG: hypothetical protein C4520_09540 [Candidatus Abyssobacteria bacterium SURF_5]|uniref:Uncharacterized protein n=1 Tax=Abyssobacteria bacterium (strain SURF_5) TaxID=2093360 RepID=A0A3A4NLI6_ABYX5|nr:MAG: hypothetical protein C4520_09540 [Candidatus Abyssubacteria bacterium SURF_5]